MKKKNTSPMQRSLKLLREQGWLCQITEHFNMFARIRQDLFGFIDILCLRKGKILAVQTTTADNSLARKKKIEANENYPLVKLAKIKIEIHGWKNKNGKWRVKIIKL